MAYLVLARKYRPERFSDMIGQDHVTRTLANAIAQNRTHHAYLFCGVRGLGKTSAARILARGLVCEKGPSADPCNACEQCKAVIEGRSVDVREIDGASHNSVDDIRSLREQVHYLPQSARRKIYIIDEVHMLTASAFNALLKTLEEPPEHVTFIFATTDPHKVLPTILSRVSRLDFRRVPLDQLIAHLATILDKEGCSAEVEGLRVVAECAEGSVRDALTLLDKVLAFAADTTSIRADEIRLVLGQSDRLALSTLVDAIVDRDVQTLLHRFDSIAASTSDLQQLAMGVLQHLRDLTVASIATDADALVHASPALYEQLREQARRIDPVTLGQLFDRLTRKVEGLDRSRNPRLLLEMALIELALTPPMLSLGAVVERLNAIAGGTNSAPLPPLGSAPSSAPKSSASASPKSVSRSSDVPRGGQSPTTSDTQAPSLSESLPVENAAPIAQSGPRSLQAEATTHADTPIPPAAPGSMADTLWKMLRGDDGQKKRTESFPVSTASHIETNPQIRNTLPNATSASSPARNYSDTQAPDWDDIPFGPGTETPPHADAVKSALRPGDDVTKSTRTAFDAPPPKTPSPEKLATSSIQDNGTPESSSDTSATLAVPRSAPSSTITEQLANEDLGPLELSADYLRWDTRLDALRGSNEDYLLALLSEVGVRRFTEDELVLVALPNSFGARQLEKDPATEKRFTAWLAEIGFSRTQVKWIDEAPGLSSAPSLNLVEAERLRRHRRDIEQRARQDAQLQKLVQTFNGAITRVIVQRDHRGTPLSREM